MRAAIAANRSSRTPYPPLLPRRLHVCVCEYGCVCVCICFCTKAAAGAGDAAAEAEELFFSAGHTFGRSLQLFRREHKKLMGKKKPAAKRRFSFLAGMTAGFDAALTKAISGKDRKKYNGSRGERGLEGQRDVAEMWTSLLIDALGGVAKLPCEDWEVACKAAWEDRTSAEYGFPSYGELIATPALETTIKAAGPEIEKIWCQEKCG